MPTHELIEDIEVRSKCYLFIDYFKFKRSLFIYPLKINHTQYLIITQFVNIHDNVFTDVDNIMNNNYYYISHNNMIDVKLIITGIFS